MSDTPEQPLEAIDELIAAELTARATPEQSAQLAALLKSDAAALHRYIRATFLHAQLRQTLSANAECGTRNAERSGPLSPWERAGVRAGDPVCSARSVSAVPSSAFRVPRSVYPLAAALLLAAAAVAIYTLALDPEPSDTAKSAAIAVLLDTDGVDWASEPLAAGATLDRRTIEIARGTLRLQTMSGAELAIEGPASVTLVTAGRVSLTRGRLHARVEGGAFAVDTPRFTVTDLGTEFAVGVGGATGDSMVAVYEGRVRIDGQVATTELGAGEGWRLASDGTAHAAAASELFVRPTDTDPAVTRYASAVRADRPRAYWRFEADLDRAVINSAGASYPATLNGGSKLTDGPLGRALRMSDRRGGDAATCDAIRSLMVGPTYTIELWVQFDAEQRGTLFSLGDLVYLGVLPTADRGVKGPSVRYVHRPRAWSNEGSGGVELFAPIEPGRWHHVAAVKSASTMTLYIDGAAVASAPQAAGLDESATAFALGRLSTRSIGNPDARPLIGQIDEVAIFDQPLTAQQIRVHYEAAASVENHGE